jgi:two-component system phosphate regulon sensor histidine kinase PhoR
MPTSQVFWRLSFTLTLFALLAVLAWGVVCGSPPTDDDLPAVVHWRWRCTWMSLGTLVAALLVSRILIRPLTEPMGALDRVARQLAQAQQSPVDGSPADIQHMGQRVAARIADLQTEQHRLEQSQDRLAIVLEAMVEGVIAVDRDSRILWANAAAVRLLDLKSGRLTSFPLESLRLPRLQELVTESIAGTDQLRLEFSVPRTQSTVVAVVSRLPGAPCPGAVIVLHDVTDLRRLETLRREFVSNVSHELKTPLAAISAYSETLLDGALDDPEINRTFVARISEQTERLNALILDLLELGRVETEAHAFEIQPVQIDVILEESVREHLNIAAAKNLKLNAIPPASPIWVLADPGGLRTIADNLIDNAIKYTTQGEVTVRWWQHGNHANIEIRDSGMGIAREHQARIFERFFRVDRARSRDVGGTGLGLSIVKHLCQVFDGDISVQSRLGQGSTFTVNLRAVVPQPK